MPKLIDLLAVALISLMPILSNAQHCPERAEPPNCNTMLLEYSRLISKYSKIVSQLKENLTAAEAQGDEAEISRLKNDILRNSHLVQTWEASYDALSTFLGESSCNLNEIDTIMDAVARARKASNYNIVAILCEPLEELLRSALMIYEVFNDRDNVLKIRQLIRTADDMLTQCAEEAKKLGYTNSSRRLNDEAGTQARLADWETQLMEQTADMVESQRVIAEGPPDHEAETERRDQVNSLLIETLHSVRPAPRANDTEKAAKPPSKRRKTSQTQQSTDVPKQVAFPPHHSK